MKKELREHNSVVSNNLLLADQIEYVKYVVNMC